MPELPQRNLFAYALPLAAVLLLGQRPATAADPVALAPVTVEATRPPAPEDTGNTSATAADRLALTPRLALRSQGTGDTQADLQVRGSSFSSVGQAVAGLGLRNPQTEHFHAELPLAPGLLAAPEVLTGLDQARAGDGFLSGTVVWEFQPVRRRGHAETGVGEIGRNWQSFFHQQPLTRPDSAVGQIGASVFGGRESASMTDGRNGNDLDRWNGGLHLQQLLPEAQTDVAFATQHKELGARGFYGAPAALPSTEELDDTLVLGSSRWSLPDDGWVRATAAVRQLEDHYLLDGTRPGLYANTHRSTLYAVNLDGGLQLADPFLFLNWRLEFAEETLASHYEGTLPATSLGNHRRQQAGLALLPEWRLGNWRLTTGGRVQLFSDDSPAWLPTLGVEHDLAPGHTLFASYTETVRQPSYTELNYNSPGSLGNQGLDRQRAQTVELGYRGQAATAWHWRAALFDESTTDAVDWVKTSAASRWLATNLDSVSSRGAELQVTWQTTRRLQLGGEYQFVHKHSDTQPYASRYVLDYPEQLTGLSASWQAAAWCELRVAQRFVLQTDNPVRTSNRHATPAEIELRLHPLPQHRNVTVTVACTNPWADEFEPFPGQAPAGRRFACALTVAW